MGGSSSQSIGYRYFMGLHMAICHGPIDSLNQIYVGERSLNIAASFDNEAININQANLFGGDEKEGGIVGTVDIEFGAGNQDANNYLTRQFGLNTPAFRGTTCVVFRAYDNPPLTLGNYTSNSGGGYLAAISPYPKAWAFDVTDIPGGPFNPTKQNISGGANGGHIIYECLTDSDWGLGIQASDLDTPSFTSVTDTLFDENFSLSMVYAQQSTMEDFIREVLTHINAVLYTDRTTNKFILRLIRDDYDESTLPIFDETNIASMGSFERPAFAELVNEIVITYRQQGSFIDSTITAQDLASIQAQDGIISQTTSFDGIDNSTIAALVAQRELRQSSTPLARCSIVANREAWNINPGDVIKISWRAYGIVQIIMRVIDVSYGTLQDGLISIEMIEDIFGLPSSSYITPVDTGWADEVTSPEVSQNTEVFELPYFVIETTLEREYISRLLDDSALLQMAVELPAVAAFSYKLNTRILPTAYEAVADGDFTPTAQLVANLDPTTLTSISIKNFSGSVNAITVGSYAYLNNEVLRIDSVDLDGELMDVGRGYLDSFPQNHLTNDIIYFIDSNDGVDPTMYTTTDVVNARALTQTSIGILDLNDAVEKTVTMVGRREKPYPAAQVRLNGLYFPTTIDSSTVAVSWTHQDRTQQLTTNGDDWYEVSLGAPEDGVLYTVRYYNNGSSTLLFTDADISGKSSSYIIPGAIGTSFSMRIEIDAIRDGTIINFETFSHIFAFNKPIEVRTLENGDTRTLENGDRRILEN